MAKQVTGELLELIARQLTEGSTQKIANRWEVAGERTYLECHIAGQIIPVRISEDEEHIYLHLPNSISSIPKCVLLPTGLMH